MKKILLFVCICLIGKIYGQVPVNSWATSIGGSGDQISLSSKLINNNIYLTGEFLSDTVIFGADTIMNIGGSDFFLVKCDTMGNILWSATAGSTASDMGSAVAGDFSGNIYAVGTYGNQPIVFGSDTLYPSGSTHMFMVKYDATGHVAWAKFGGSDVSPNDIAIDNHGNIFVSGIFTGTKNFGSTTLTSNGGTDIFLAKYDQSGNVLWAASAGGTANDHVTQMVLNSHADIYITGSFIGTIAFGTTTLNSSGGSDAYVARYDSSGNAHWATAPASVGDENGEAVAIDMNDNLVFSGSNTAPLTFGSTNISKGGFLAKYDDTGNLRWAADLMGARGSGVFCNSSGNIIVSADFDTTVTIGTTVMSPIDGSDLMIAGFASAGSPEWAASFGCNGNENLPEIFGDSGDNIFIAGNYEGGSINFGSIAMNTDSGNTDIYLAKFNRSCFPLTPTISLAGNLLNVTSSYATYQWMMNGNTIAGATGQIYTPTVEADYSVAVTDTNGCSGTSNIIHVIISGIETVNELSLKIYPNPATDKLFIEQGKPIGLIELYNSFGQKVIEMNSTEKKVTLNVSDLPSGNYLLKSENTSKQVLIKR